MSSDKNGGPNHLRAWRKYRRRSQEWLAERLNTTGSVVSLLESGQRPLSAKALRQAGEALETTPGNILDHDPNDLPINVIDIWSAIPESDRAQAERVLQTFSKRNG